MPELPEVETVRISLARVLPGQIIQEAFLSYPPLISFPSPEVFLEQVLGRELGQVHRRGKFLLLSLGEQIMALHLRMTGSLLMTAKGSPVEKHTHLRLILKGGGEMHYVDPRKFGRILLLPAWEDIGIRKNLGPEPLSPHFSFSSFRERIGNRRGRIKSLLLNQSFLAGIGNIYGDEILFAAGIHPGRKANTCRDEELERLYHSIQRVLQEGIAHQGTTISNFRDGVGQGGVHQQYLRVYGRQGQECSVCGQVLVKEKIGGRSSVFCPVCQR